jgi:antitoxin (DNA-binding transcriptional repressor) of toxin-antitoxin stability system
MLRRDTPQTENNELNKLLRRLARGGSVTVMLGGEEIAKIEPEARRATPGHDPADAGDPGDEPREAA